VDVRSDCGVNVAAIVGPGIDVGDAVGRDIAEAVGVLGAATRVGVTLVADVGLICAVSATVALGAVVAEGARDVGCTVGAAPR